MAITFDSALNFLVPTLLILIVVGFVYIKFIGPYLVPLLIKLWDWMKGKSEHQHKEKEIRYE